MLTNLRRKSLATSLALLLCGFATTSLAAGGSAPTSRAAPIDLGASNPAQTVNVTLVLGLHHQDALEQYIYSTVTPGNPSYHRFLTTA
jgi:kumamolisin